MIGFSFLGVECKIAISLILLCILAIATLISVGFAGISTALLKRHVEEVRGALLRKLIYPILPLLLWLSTLAYLYFDLYQTYIPYIDFNIFKSGLSYFPQVAQEKQEKILKTTKKE